MRNTLSASCIFVTALVAGCGDSGGAGEGGSSGGSSSTTEGVSTGEEPTTGEPFVAFPARGGIVISAVEANPGVAVPIGKDGAPVGGADRNSFIPKNRDTLIRVFVDVPDDWTPRKIEARLQLTGSGVDTTLVQTLLIEKDTAVGALDTGFYFGAEAKDMVPGVKYQVELWEAEAGQEMLPDEGTPLALKDGPSFVGVESGFAELRVVLVPVDYKFGTCAKVVDGEAQRKSFEDAIFQQNGIESLELTVHAPYKVDYNMVDFSGLSRLVNEMSQLRTAEGADDNVYYYGLFDSCNGCIGDGGGCTVGLAANITGPDPSDARDRAAVGQLIGNPAETFVHEIGHTQGRQHVYCAGAGVQAQGTDPSYPHEDGRIGVWGFGIRDFKLRHPTANSDYMSYCGRVWVSDWQWNATYSRILALSKWAKNGAGKPADDGAAGPGVLIGAVDPDGQQMWWTGPGGLSSSRELSATHSVVFQFADGEVEAPAQVSVREHYATRNIVAVLPAGFDERELVGVKLRDEDGGHPIEAASIRRLHHPDQLKSAP